MKLSIKNLLPFDGEAYYYNKIFSYSESINLFEKLLNNLIWENDRVMMYGKLIITKRKTAWYGSQNFEYTYSKIKREALPFNNELFEIKSKVEEISGNTYNSVLCNLYHNGNEAMGWHSDNEKELKPLGAIASISFGAERRFDFKHNTKQEKVSQLLENGSLLVMKNETQLHWKHQIPISKKILLPRINLTFRTII